MARDPGLPRRIGTQAARRAVSFRIFGEVVGEIRRVTWPTRQETMRLTLMVISVAVVIGIFLGIVDLGFSRLLDVLLGN
ncbi:MAG: preprotein translocase subunit SecE [SAR202 cluster bacterium Io17-Chloro-G1]|nr:preprotein translocase subunit SecE [Dehalococcoidia bacterium]MAX20067.1 preprotein translocase subunit SecE [Chloroflexota bacterium]PKB62824.1 MAG: preprotein translocase subunit SecE [SAR202 cluster bacterium Io17-Chloro-G1]MBE13329.1 preprotein translocase subunit SecE [Chloroflexota bacterium]HCH08710.1 preprotein translocase subunit SecE [Dehalococcoidia bacterium]